MKDLHELDELVITNYVGLTCSEFIKYSFKAT